MTTLAELWGKIRRHYDPNGFDALMIWSRFLMGGGGLVLALLLGALAIAAGQRAPAYLSRRPAAILLNDKR